MPTVSQFFCEHVCTFLCDIIGLVGRETDFSQGLLNDRFPLIRIEND